MHWGYKTLPEARDICSEKCYWYMDMEAVFSTVAKTVVCHYPEMPSLAPGESTELSLCATDWGCRWRNMSLRSDSDCENSDRRDYNKEDSGDSFRVGFKDISGTGGYH